MKTIFMGIAALTVSVVSMIFLQDATAAVFFIPLGIYLIYGGIRYGNRFITDEFWKDRR